jgi:glycosyltransferase involved in cell wall biosynthesis
MRISVVIPSYNRAHTLQRALQSVYQQSSAVDEVILVDDGSTDDSNLALADLFPALTIIRQSHQGVSAARNRGIRAARHDWIALLDSDDCWLPRKIETIRAAAAENPDFILYHSDEIWIRDGVHVNPMRKHRKTGGWIFQQCLPLCAISPSTTVIQKATLQTLGLFDENLPACEDYDLWLRLCHRFPVYFVDQPLVTRYGGHDDQLSQQHPQMDRFRVRSLARLLDSAELRPDDFEAARATLQRKLDILLKGARKHDNRAVIDEFEPLQQRWCDSPRCASC